MLLKERYGPRAKHPLLTIISLQFATNSWRPCMQRMPYRKIRRSRHHKVSLGLILCHFPIRWGKSCTVLWYKTRLWTRPFILMIMQMTTGEAITRTPSSAWRDRATFFALRIFCQPGSDGRGMPTTLRRCTYVRVSDLFSSVSDSFGSVGHRERIRYLNVYGFPRWLK